MTKSYTQTPRFSFSRLILVVCTSFLVLAFLIFQMGNMSISYTNLFILYLLCSISTTGLIVMGVAIAISFLDKRTGMTSWSRKLVAVILGVIIAFGITSVIAGGETLFSASAGILPDLEHFHSTGAIIKALGKRLLWEEILTTPTIRTFLPLLILSINLSVMGGYFAGKVAKHDEIKLGFATGFVTLLVSILFNFVLKIFIGTNTPFWQQLLFAVFILCSTTIGGYLAHLHRSQNRSRLAALLIGNLIFSSIVAIRFDTYFDVNASPRVVEQAIMLGRFVLCISLAIAASVAIDKAIRGNTFSQNFSKKIVLIIFVFIFIYVGANIENHIQPALCCGDGHYREIGYPYRWISSWGYEFPNLFEWNTANFYPLAFMADIVFASNLIFCLLPIGKKTHLWLTKQIKKTKAL